jgi:hypothetical protein
MQSASERVGAANNPYYSSYRLTHAERTAGLGRERDRDPNLSQAKKKKKKQLKSQLLFF